MKLVLILTILGLIVIHLSMSALVLMQARRLKHITRTNKGVTWIYLITTLMLWIGILISATSIQF